MYDKFVFVNNFENIICFLVDVCYVGNVFCFFGSFNVVIVLSDK